MQRSTSPIGRLVLCAAVSLLGLAAGAGVARADVNPTPIAVPLLGTQGAGSPYPSTVHVTSRGGPGQSGMPMIILHAVTHPCIEDLAVLLVHNNSEKFLLLSNAGGCKPLQGTDIIFSPLGLVVPDTEPDLSTPYGQTIVITTSNYSTPPVFPAPAPAGPYITTFPSAFFEGQWDLYVTDTTTSNRGVIAAGWSFHYPTQYTFNAVGTGSGTFPVGLPGGGTSGPAATSPITFDLSALPAGVKAQDIKLTANLSHSHPDDINLMLQAPNGNAVLVMSHAGGGNAIANVSLSFVDSAAGSLPDSTTIATGSYKPTAFGTFTPTPHADPAMPTSFGTTLGTLTGQDARGIWKLWAFDDADPNTGTINSASLTINTEIAPTITINLPTTGTTYTATTPFVHFAGTIPNLSNSPHSATWFTMVGGTYYASGPMTFTPGSDVVAADIPMKKGTNFVQIFVRNTDGVILAEDDVDTTVNEFVYTLSEGATGGFFDLDVTMANPTGAPAPLSISFLPEHSAPVPFASSVAANALTQLHVNDLTPADAISTIVHSTDAIPLAVERTMAWDSTGYGGSGGTAIFPDTHWLFAEGSQGYFDTFILLSNDGATAANANVKFLIEGGSPVIQPVVIPAHSRVTVYAGDVVAVRNTSFGLDITADQPITAERSMYFPHDGPRIWEGGHETGGATSTSTHWFLAEGATGPFFECFVLLSNPTSTPAHVSLSYLLPDGSTVPQTVTVPANGRLTINIEHDVDPTRLGNTAVSTTINSDVGIIVERSMYWPDISIGWREAHNSVGVTEAALRWAVADGRIGGPRNDQTYILLANPNSTPAEVQVRFLKAGAAPFVKTYTLPATSRTNIAPASESDLLAALGPGVFSADVQVLNFQPIVVEKALYWDSNGEVWAAGTGTVGVPIPPE